MQLNNLNILVLIRETRDPRPPARLTTRGTGISDRGMRWIPNPADLSALEEALLLKDALGASVTALAIGPERLDDTLRLAIAMGASRAIRFHDHGLEGSDAVADARLLARITGILKPSLIFTGNRLTDRGDDPAPSLAAAMAEMPSISSVVSMSLKSECMEAVRKGDRGGRQTVAAAFPCTVLFEEVREPRYPSLEAITHSLAVEIEHWGFPEVGLPFWLTGSAGAYLPVADYGVPRPLPVRTVTPDPRLPAYERILSLLSGGISAREGKTHHLPVDETVEGLCRIFREEGLLPEVQA